MIHTLFVSSLRTAVPLCLALLATGITEAQSIGTAPFPLPPAAATSRVFLTDQTLDVVLVAEDFDLDGTFNGIGEVSIYYDDSSAQLDLGTPRFLVAQPNGVVFVGDSNIDVVLRLEDLNLDGDANDVDEATIYFDGLGGGPVPQAIDNMILDDAGFLYLSDNGSGSPADAKVLRIRDENGDGICTFADGEVIEIHRAMTTTGTPIARPSGIAFAADGSMIVSDYDTDGFLRLVDGNGDGDANDAGEQLPWFASAPGGLELTFTQTIAFATDAPNAPLYVNGGSTLDAIYIFEDTDGNGTIENPAEVRTFWDTTQADGVIPAIAWRMAVAPDGALWVTEGGQTSAAVGDQLVRLIDLNFDGDANDAGEARIILDDTNASGFDLGTLMGIAFEPVGTISPPDPVFVRGDCNDDGTSNIADAIALLGFLFPTGAPTVILCDDACDGNDDENLDIADAVAILGALFGTPAVPLPAPGVCGPDPDGVGGALGCDFFGECP